MKKFFFAVLLLAGFSSLQAQTDSTLKEFTGKYLFPEGSPVREIVIKADSAQLVGTSVMGNSEFRKTESKDVFDIVAFAGVATFKRNDKGIIISLLIQVQDITMEGEKAPAEEAEKKQP